MRPSFQLQINWKFPLKRRWSSLENIRIVINQTVFIILHSSRTFSPPGWLISLTKTSTLIYLKLFVPKLWGLIRVYSKRYFWSNLSFQQPKKFFFFFPKLLLSLENIREAITWTVFSGVTNTILSKARSRCFHLFLPDEQFRFWLNLTF